MPFTSKAQQRFMFSQHPDIAKRWAKEMKQSGQSMKNLPPQASQSANAKQMQQAAQAKLAQEKQQPGKRKKHKGMSPAQKAAFQKMIASKGGGKSSSGSSNLNTLPKGTQYIYSYKNS